MRHVLKSVLKIEGKSGQRHARVFPHAGEEGWSVRNVKAHIVSRRLEKEGWRKNSYRA